MSKALLSLRLFAFVVYGYSIYYQIGSKAPGALSAFGKFKYLTYWDLLLQFSFFALVLFGDSLLRLRSASFSRAVDLIFFSLAYPVGLLVSIIFWTLFAIDRDLIFPKAVEVYYPVWLNHTTHTFVSMLILVELMLGKHRLPSKKSGLLLLNIAMAAYSLWVLYIALGHNIWVYPFLEILNWPQRIAFFTVSILFSSLVFYTGVVLNNLVGKPTASNKPKAHKRK